MQPNFEAFLRSCKSEDLAALPRFLIFGLISNRIVAHKFDKVEGAFVVSEQQFKSRYPLVTSAPLYSAFYLQQKTNFPTTFARMNPQIEEAQSRILIKRHMWKPDHLSPSPSASSSPSSSRSSSTSVPTDAPRRKASVDSEMSRAKKPKEDLSSSSPADPPS